MKQILKLVKIGNGRGVILPKDILDKLEKEVGDYIEIEIKEEV